MHEHDNDGLAGTPNQDREQQQKVALCYTA